MMLASNIYSTGARVLDRFTSTTLRKLVAWLVLPAAGVVSFISMGVGTAPAIPAVQLAPEPLYAKGTRDKPTLTLALSVEFPTVGAQYLDSYAADKEYIGYFDADSCYAYINDATESLRRFDRTGAASSHKCGGTGFSGNFMNWATSSAIDVLRLGLTGGDRIVDSASMTVLQRAVLPKTFFNSGNFPSKQLPAASASDAVPSTLRGTYTGDVYIANCLDRVHFGTSRDGSCDSPGSNSNLGVGTSTREVGPVATYNGSLPSGATQCASENGDCTFSDTKLVYFGAANSWKRAPAAGGGLACSNTVFGDPIVGTAKKCYYTNYSGSWAPTSPTTSRLTSNPFFYSRVKVCDSGSTGLTDPRSNLCLKYPSGNFKPVGNLQKYSDRVRVAAFGYIMDNQQSRYGGVLRAPMKYVGPKAYDNTGTLISSGNPGVEWSEDDGTLKTNPENASESKSGVINYLNQFGRTGATAGTYKTFDPVGELYYESLRYLQGLPPTPEATNGMTDAMKDGFPVYTSWNDPHSGGSKDKDYSCLKNNILMIGDVNTHNDKSIPGNPSSRMADSEFTRSASIAANEPNFWEWTKVVGGFEANRSVTYLDGKGGSKTTTNPLTANDARWGMENQDIGATRASYYMAGMAYWANTHDIRGNDWSDAEKRRPGMRVTTYMLDVNEYGSQTDANTRHNNQFFLSAKYGGFKDQSGYGNPFINKNGASDATIWSKPTDAAEAKTYFLSSSAREVLNSLDEIFANIATEGNSIAGGAVSTTRLTTTGGYIYQAQFDPSDWSGDLVAYPITVDSSNNVTVGNASTALWKAAAKLDAKTPDSRKIFVGKARPDSATATEFLSGSIEDTLTTALNKPTPSAPADTLGASRLLFLRGDRSLEGTSFRRRGNVLGDIVNSGVAYSGAPTRNVSSDLFSTFYNTNKDRVPALFVGANDGMLHAFNANDGNELFAYIPSWLGGKLSALTTTTYNSGNHQSYVDASPAVAEAQVGDVVKTVLVGGTGGGGQGVFALDVTDPTSFAADKVLWEFTDSADPDIGNVVGLPQILKFKTSGATGTATYKYFAVVTSGVNNYVDDGRFSTTGKPALFLLDLAKPKGTAWSEGTNYYKILLPIDATASATMPTGLINLKATPGLAGEVAYVYLGDMLGNVWKLDFTQVAFSALGTVDTPLTKLSAFKSGSTPIPMYIAKDGSGRRQPITMEPTVVAGPGKSTIVLVGTGKYLEGTDNSVSTTTPLQSIYALFDNGTATPDSSGTATAIISGRGRLQAGTVSGTTVTVASFAWGRATSDTDTSQRSGWYFDLGRGERQVSSFGVFGDTLVFGSVIPPDSADACGAGSGNQYVLNISTGSGSFEASKVGMLGEPLVFQLPATVTPRGSDGKSVQTVPGRLVVQGSTGLGTVATQPSFKNVVGRLSWRQIPNYQELKHNVTP